MVAEFLEHDSAARRDESLLLASIFREVSIVVSFSCCVCVTAVGSRSKPEFCAPGNV